MIIRRTENQWSENKDTREERGRLDHQIEAPGYILSIILPFL